MFCMECGTQLPDHAKFCLRCGAPVMKETQPRQAIMTSYGPSWSLWFLLVLASALGMFIGSSILSLAISAAFWLSDLRSTPGFLGFLFLISGVGAMIGAFYAFLGLAVGPSMARKKILEIFLRRMKPDIEETSGFSAIAFLFGMLAIYLVLAISSAIYHILESWFFIDRPFDSTNLVTSLIHYRTFAIVGFASYAIGTALEQVRLLKLSRRQGVGYVASSLIGGMMGAAVFIMIFEVVSSSFGQLGIIPLQGFPGVVAFIGGCACGIAVTSAALDLFFVWLLRRRQVLLVSPGSV